MATVREVGDGLLAALPELRIYARSLTRDPGAAEDLVQDAAATALAAAHRFAPDTNFRAWSFTILRNLHINAARRARCPAAPVPVDPATLALWHIGPGAQDPRIRLREALRALARLPAEQRHAVLMIAAGEDYATAARRCGVAVGTFKSRLSRGRRDLRASIDAA